MAKRIIVGLDGSDHAKRALEFAIEEVRRREDAVLVALHAYLLPIVHELDAGDPPLYEGLEERARQQLEEWLVGVVDDVRIETLVAPGSAARALIEASAGADLVIVGSRGRGGFRSLLLGSTSQQLVFHARCPVVVVRGTDWTPPVAEITDDESTDGPRVSP